MSKTFVYINTIEELIHIFTIIYMINHTLHVNRVFRYQAETFLKYISNQNTIQGIKNIPRTKNTCVISIVMFYETKKFNISVWGVKFCTLLCHEELCLH